MRRLLLALSVTGLFLLQSTVLRAEAPVFSAADWPWWRGPTRNGIAAAKQNVPLKWSESENVLWKSPIPGRGHGSPTVVGDQVFLATADREREVQSVLCFDRRTGKRLWETEVHRGGFEKKGNAKSSLASSTVACDGERLFINFLHGGTIYTTALSREGKQLWQTKITDYVLHQGYGSSPAVYKSLVIISADNKGGGAIAALERASGKVVWKQERPKLPNYASPIILNVAGRDQLLLTGCDLVSSFDPLTGKKNWEIKGSTTECVTSTVTDGELIFTSGGYPKNHVAAVRANGSGKIAWEKNTRVYVPSMIVRDKYLYAVLDCGHSNLLEVRQRQGSLDGPPRRYVHCLAGAGRRTHLRHERSRKDVHLQGDAGRVRLDRPERSTRRGPRHADHLRGSHLSADRHAGERPAARDAVLYRQGRITGAA